MKKSFKPGAVLSPLPVVMVSCQGKDPSAKPNIITIAWTGIINSDPPMTYISVRKSRYSHEIISETGEFVINLVNEKLTFACDWCGVKSGRDVDKFAEMKLTPVPAEAVACPLIEEAPINLECKVREVHEYPTHDMFVAEIININADDEVLDESGRLRFDKAKLIAYNHGEYFAQKPQAIGRFGYSIMKPETRKRIENEKRREAKKTSSPGGKKNGRNKPAKKRK